MKIAVTGANGMTGRHMLALLKEKGIPYKAITRNEWDICKWKSFDELDAIFNECKAAFHFAAQLPGERGSTENLFDANVRSCLNLAEWATDRSIPIVFLSGSTVYKNAHKENILESDEKVINGFGGFYGYTKFLAENIFEHYKSEGLKSIILRSSSIYGYGLSSDKLIPHYLSLAGQGEIIKISQPNNKINLIHAYDVAMAALTAFQSKSWGVFNIGSRNQSIIEIAKMAVKVMGKGEISIEDFNENIESFTRFDLDSSLAKKTFGFKPGISLEKGMRSISLGREKVC